MVDVKLFVVLFSRRSMICGFSLMTLDGFESMSACSVRKMVSTFCLSSAECCSWFVIDWYVMSVVFGLWKSLV